MEKARRSTDRKEIVQLIVAFSLPRECIPTQFLTEPEVWEALLIRMPMTAMLRNLATMTRVGLLTPMSAALRKITDELVDEERLKKARIHPIAMLAALKTYAQGHGERGKHTWEPIAQVIDALDSAFYLTFKNVEPTDRQWYLGIDVSGGMSGSKIAGMPGLDARTAAGALALVTANTGKSWYMAAFSHGMVPFAPSPRQRLDDFCRLMSSIPMGGTDCALPMLDALEKKLEIDVFVIYTDSESWIGKIHASQALQMYRQKMGIPAKAICVGMCANEFSVLDPDDAGSLNVVGLDTATPAMMVDFVR